MPTLKYDANPKVSFQAREIEAFFPDGRVAFSNDDIQFENRTNDRLVVVLQRGSDTQHAVRLYLTTPLQDWRSDANFTWALSMAWMRVPSVVDMEEEDTDGWLYWNQENNVASQIRAFSGMELFSADSVTLHFRAMDRFPWVQRGVSPQVPDTKLVIKDVLLGAHLEQADPPGRHRPCQSNVCHIVDGVVASESAMVLAVPAILPRGAPIYLLALAVGIPALVVLLGVVRFLRRRRVEQKYDPIE